MPIYIGDNTPCSFQFNKYPPKVAPTLSCAIYKRIVNDQKYLTLVGTFEDYEHKHLYYDEYADLENKIYGHGIVYMESVRLNTMVLTINTPGRNRVNFGGYAENGNFIYHISESKFGTEARVWALRAFYIYKRKDGLTDIIYSKTVRGKYENSPEWET